MALVTTIRQSLLSTRWVPWWLTGRNRGRILYAIGLALDAGAEWAVQGIQQRLPLWCDEGALSWLGRDRGIIRGQNESTVSYRQRLVQWRDTWRRAGTAFSVLENVQAYFLPEVPVVRLVCHHVSTNTADWYTRGANGVETFYRAGTSNWDWDSTDPLRPVSLGTRDTRFWVIVYQDQDTSDLFALDRRSPIQVYDFADATSYGAPEKGQDLSTMARTWKMAGSWCAGVIVAFDPALFSPTGSGADYPDGTWHRYADPVTHGINRAMPARYLEIKNSTADSVGA